MTSPETPDRVLSLKHASLLFGSQEIVSRVTTISLSLFAARSLGPAEIGGLGLAVIVSSLISMVASCPESAAVFLDRSYGTNGAAAEGARLRLLITTLLVAPVLIWTEPIVVFLNGRQNDGVAHLVRLMLFVPCLEALAAEPSIRAQRALDLAYLGRIQLATILAYVTLAFAALATGLGVVGMVASQILATAGLTAFLLKSGRKRWVEHENRPPQAAGPEVRRGAWRLFVGGFGGFLGARLDSVLVSRSLGAVGLGLYSTAWSASRLCATVVTRAINSTLGPLLPQIGVGSDRAVHVLKRTYVVFILLAGIFSTALVVWTPLVVPLLLGDKWLPAIAALQVMSVSAFCTPVAAMIGLVLNTSRRAHLILWGTAAHLTVLTGLIPPLARAFGVVGGALGEVLAAVAVTGVLLGVLRRSGLSIDWIDRRATLWSVLGLAPSAVAAAWIDPGTTKEPVMAGIAVTASLAFLFVVSCYAPFREILSAFLKSASGALSLFARSARQIP